MTAAEVQPTLLSPQAVMLSLPEEELQEPFSLEILDRSLVHHVVHQCQTSSRHVPADAPCNFTALSYATVCLLHGQGVVPASLLKGSHPAHQPECLASVASVLQAAACGVVHVHQVKGPGERRQVFAGHANTFQALLQLRSTQDRVTLRDLVIDPQLLQHLELQPSSS